MNKEEYIQALRKKLSSLPDEEIENAIQYVREYYEECEDDKRAYEQLGDPQKFAAQIKAEFIIRQNEKQDDASVKSKKSLSTQYNLKNILIIILGIFSLPISVPLALVVIALVFVLVIILAIPFFVLLVLCFAFLFSIAVCVKVILSASSLLLTEILAIISAVMIFVSLLCLSLAALLALGGRFIPWLIQKLGQLFHRLKGEKTYELYD